MTDLERQLLIILQVKQYDIIELLPTVNGKELRVLMFKIPAAVTGIPADWKTNYYERSGEKLTGY